MKFSHQLQFNQVPDWCDHYIQYESLRRILYTIAKAEAETGAHGTDTEDGHIEHRKARETVDAEPMWHQCEADAPAACDKPCMPYMQACNHVSHEHASHRSCLHAAHEQGRMSRISKASGHCARPPAVAVSCVDESLPASPWLAVEERKKNFYSSAKRLGQDS